jgi:L-asparaginase II
MEKIGIKTEDFLCGAEPSINIEYALIQARNNVTLYQIHNDCSGKHSGMLATCIHKGYSIKEYTSPNHPIQQDIKKIVSYMCNIEENKIIIGVDGCDVPVFGMPLIHIAQAYARFTTPSILEENYKDSAIKIFNAMNNHPEMIAGTNGFCTELIKNTNRKLIGKLGAEGVYCVGIKDKDIGIAVKMECGSIRALSSVVIKILEDLNILSENEKQTLSKYKIKENKNSINRTIGFIRPIFNIKKAI